MEKIVIKGKDFITAVRKTADIALQYKDNATLTNICIITHNNKIDFTAVCHEVFIIHTIPAKVEGAENQKYLINPKALKYIADRTVEDDEIEITIENHKITFKSSNYNLTTKLSPERFTTFPDYRKIIPKQYDAVVEISKSDLLDTIKKAVVKKTWENKWIGKFETICLRTLTDSIVVEAPIYITTKNEACRTATTDATVKSDKDTMSVVKDTSIERVLNLIDSDAVVLSINSDYIVITSKDANEKTIGIVETLWMLRE